MNIGVARAGDVRDRRQGTFPALTEGYRIGPTRKHRARVYWNGDSGMGGTDRPIRDRRWMNEGAMRGFVMIVIYWEAAKAHFQSYLSEESGATAMEYVLLASGIGIGILLAVAVLGDTVAAMFGDVATEVTE